MMAAVCVECSGLPIENTMGKIGIAAKKIYKNIYFFIYGIHSTPRKFHFDISTLKTIILQKKKNILFYL